MNSLWTPDQFTPDSRPIHSGLQTNSLRIHSGLHTNSLWTPDQFTPDSRPIHSGLQTNSLRTPDQFTLDSRPIHSGLQTNSLRTPDQFTLDSRPIHSGLQTNSLWTDLSMWSWERRKEGDRQKCWHTVGQDQEERVNFCLIFGSEVLDGALHKMSF